MCNRYILPISVFFYGHEVVGDLLKAASGKGFVENWLRWPMRFRVFPVMKVTLKKWMLVAIRKPARSPEGTKSAAESVGNRSGQ